jgi:hypothetical protein
MSRAYLAYLWDYIEPYGNAAISIHGYSTQEVVNYSAVPRMKPGLWGSEYGPEYPYHPEAAVNLTQGEAHEDLNRTIFRTVHVQNLAPYNPIAVDLLCSTTDITP